MRVVAELAQAHLHRLVDVRLLGQAIVALVAKLGVVAGSLELVAQTGQKRRSPRLGLMTEIATVFRNRTVYVRMLPDFMMALRRGATR